ncbi:ACT domain-containing protein [Oenococcus alcoholitolerans]
MKKAVITVVGDDKPGIIAAVSTRLSENQINILDVSQTLMDNVFTMSMLVDITKVDDKFQELQNSLKELGKNMSVSIHTQRQEIFDTISKI